MVGYSQSRESLDGVWHAASGPLCCCTGALAHLVDGFPQPGGIESAVLLLEDSGGQAGTVGRRQRPPALKLQGVVIGIEPTRPYAFAGPGRLTEEALMAGKLGLARDWSSEGGRRLGCSARLGDLPTAGIARR